MEKFSKSINKNSEKDNSDKENYVFKSKYINVIDKDSYLFVKESDFAVCIIYLVDTNQIVLRYESIPPFEYADGQEFHITVLSGTIEKGETPYITILREIEEESGIVISPDFKIEFMKPLFISKGHASKYHPCIIQLTENDYHEVMPKGDGSKMENKSKSVKLDVKYLNSINTSDLITDYMIIKIKEYLNIK